MGSECYHHDLIITSTPPKLSLFSLPINRAVEPPGMLTPPIKTQASVPFQWEEAPGKPRRSYCVEGDSYKPNKSVVKCLELPPRLLTETRMPSPTTVIDGPYGGGGSGRYGLGLLRKGGGWSSFRSHHQAGDNNKERVFSFGSSRWGSSRKKEEVGDGGGGGGGGFDFLFSDVKSEDESYYSRDGTEVKITRVKKNRSLRSFRSSTTTTTKSHNNHFLMSIYESFKQVVPLSWSRRSSRN